MGSRSAPDDSLGSVPVTVPARDNAATEFGKFYERELATQVRRAALIVGDPQTARDLVHDSFADVFQRWSEVRDPGPYLNTVVLNRCRDHLRRDKRRSQAGYQPVLNDQPDDGPLWDALQALPFNHRAVLALRFHEQMTDREIADTLGCRIGSVGPWIQRGLTKLRMDLS
jgi:RNA polymerase sigma factor (sigma-70 family)